MLTVIITLTLLNGCGGGNGDLRNRINDRFGGNNTGGAGEHKTQEEGQGELKEFSRFARNDFLHNDKVLVKS